MCIAAFRQLHTAALLHPLPFRPSYSARFIVAESVVHHIIVLILIVIVTNTFKLIVALAFAVLVLCPVSAEPSVTFEVTMIQLEVLRCVQSLVDHVNCESLQIGGCLLFHHITGEPPVQP